MKWNDEWNRLCKEAGVPENKAVEAAVTCICIVAGLGLISIAVLWKLLVS